MPRIRKNTEYPLVFLTDYNAEDVLAGDRCKFIKITETEGNIFLVEVELKVNRAKGRSNIRICFHDRLKGIEKYLEELCQG